MHDITGLYYIGKLSKKLESEYTNKKNEKAINYRLKFEFLGGYEIINCTKDFYILLTEGNKYMLNIGKTTKEGLDFVSLYVKSKDGKNYEFDSNGELIELSN